MKKLKISLLALILATGAAVATANPKLDDVKWRPLYNQDNEITGWENINGQESGTDYDCDSQLRVCSAMFPQGTTPSAATPVPANHEDGGYN